MKCDHLTVLFSYKIIGRLSSHSLRIESGRYERNRLDRSLRTCQICNTGDVEDEYHLILICNQYLDLGLNISNDFTTKNQVCTS